MTVEPKASLADFIRENSTLVTSFAAFIALTAFSQQIDDSGTKVILPALTFIGALLLGIELMSKMPPKPHQCRLALFDLILAPLLLVMFYYWFAKFPSLWVPAVASVITLSIYFAVAIVVTQVFRIFATLGASMFRRAIHPKTFQLISLAVFMTAFAIEVIGTRWFVQHHPVALRIPAVR